MPPKQLFLLRHAEKPEDENPHLSVKGFARASALPLLFAPALSCSPRLSDSKLVTTQYAGAPTASRFPAPHLLIATKHGKISNRPIETITPLAAALGLPIAAEHEDDDFETVATHVLTHDKFTGKVVLICWHHGKLLAFARALMTRPFEPDPSREDDMEQESLFGELWKKGKLPTTPPFIWPDSRIHEGSGHYTPMPPARNLFADADLINGLIVGVANETIRWLAELLRKERKRICLVLVVFPAGPTRKEHLGAIDCGASAPDVLLQVDHVNPVVAGGTTRFKAWLRTMTELTYANRSMRIKRAANFFTFGK